MKRYRGYSLVAVVWIAGWNPPVLSAQTSASNFVAITPCRVVDTRGPAGDFGGPSMQAQTSRDFPILSSPCGIPSMALAYAFDIAAVPAEPLSYLTVWPTGAPQPTTSNLNSPSGQVIANAVLVAAGTNGSVSIYVSNATDIVLDITGYFVAAPAPVAPADPDPPDTDPPDTDPAPGIASGNQNTAIGFNTLQVNTGDNNTSMGAYTLAGNTSGNNNVAFGADALIVNASGSANSAVGGEALANNLIGNDNTAVGFSAMWANNVGVSNTVLGASALYTDTGGSYNVAVGQEALFAGTGSWNIAVGYEAGNQVSVGSYNILIGNSGMTADSNTIRIGTAANQTATYISGINTSTVGGTQVLVNGSGQLGVATSSERFKEDIHDMGDASDELMLLRPVTFRYKQAFDDGSKPVQYGLLGEEVAKVYPELVVYNHDRQVESLKYQELPALLLNEVQKEHKTIQELEARIAALEAQQAKQHAHKRRR